MKGPLTEFLVTKTKVPEVTKRFDLNDPVQRKEYFEAKVGPEISKLKEYLKEIKLELGHVVWPTKKQTLNYTLMVVGLSVVVAYFLGLFDYIFLVLLENVI